MLTHFIHIKRSRYSVSMPLDYNQLANTYDSHRHGGGPYGESLLRLARSTPHRDVLELGAGTALNTEFFLAQVPCRLVALELSRGMLREGRAKGLAAQWVNGHATRLPFAASAFDFIFGTYMLHHVRDLHELFAGVFHALRPGGRIALITVRHEFIRAHPMNYWFRSFAAVDLRRFQPLAQIKSAMTAAGLVQVESIHDQDPPRPIDHAYVERVENKFISTYELLPPREFKEGVKRLRRDVETDAPGVPRSIIREATTITGLKP